MLELQGATGSLPKEGRGVAGGDDPERAVPTTGKSTVFPKGLWITLASLSVSTSTH